MPERGHGPEAEGRRRGDPVNAEPRLAFCFPGQGSQAVGMGRAFHEVSSAARAVFEEASDALGMDVAKLCFEGPEDALQLTANTQPAVLTVSVAAARVLAERGVRPSMVGGHSLGEYSALVVAGALAFRDAVRVVRQRGEFMQEAVPVGTGAMAAILGVDLAVVEEVCREAARGEVVDVANINAPGQIVVAGNRGAVERAVALAAERGGRRSVLLPVSAPFHCRLMAPAAERSTKNESESAAVHAKLAGSIAATAPGRSPSASEAACCSAASGSRSRFSASAIRWSSSCIPRTRWRRWKRPSLAPREAPST